MARPPTRSLLALAGPMTLARAGIAGMAIADALMVARFDTTALARLGIAEAVIGRMLDIMIAFLLGGAALAAAALRSDDPACAGAIWRRAMKVSALLGLLGAFAGLAGGPALRLVGEDADLAAAAGPVMTILGLSVPASLAAIASAVFLEAAGRPGIVAVLVVAANFLNLALNWSLIGGHGVIPALGAAGSALSTALVRLVLMAALVARVWTLPERDRVGIRRPARLRDGAPEFRLGFSTAVTAAVLNALGLTLTVFGGWLGPQLLAALVALWTILSLGALIALGIADATAIMVAADRPGAAAILRHNTAAAVGILAIPAAFAAADPAALAALFGGDAAFKADLAGLIRPGAAVLLLDALGFTLAGGLRGLGDAAVPAALQIIAAAGLTLGAWLLAFGLGAAASGLVWAMLLGSFVRAVLLAARTVTILSASRASPLFTATG